MLRRQTLVLARLLALRSPPTPAMQRLSPSSRMEAGAVCGRMHLVACLTTEALSPAAQPAQQPAPVQQHATISAANTASSSSSSSSKARRDEKELHSMLQVCARAEDVKSATQHLAAWGHSAWTSSTLAVFLEHLVVEPSGQRLVRLVKDLMESQQLEALHCFLLADKIQESPYGERLGRMLAELVGGIGSKLDPAGALAIMFASGLVKPEQVQQAIEALRNAESATVLALYALSRRQMASKADVAAGYEELQTLLRTADWSRPVFWQTRAVVGASRTVLMAAARLGDPAMLDSPARWLRRVLPTNLRTILSPTFDQALLKSVEVALVHRDGRHPNAITDASQQPAFDSSHLSVEQEHRRIQRWLSQANALVTDIVDGRIEAESETMDSVISYLSATQLHQSGEFATVRFITDVFVAFERRGYMAEMQAYNRWSASGMRSSRGTAAWEVMQRMVSSGVVPDGTSYGAVFDAIALSGGATDTYSFAGQVEQQMISQGIQYDLQLVKRAIKAFITSWRIELATQRLADMRHDGFVPSADLYTLFFSTIGSASLSDNATHLQSQFGQRTQLVDQPDGTQHRRRRFRRENAYSCALFALKDLRWTMKRDGVVGGPDTYAGLLQCSVVAQDVLTAIQLCEEMVALAVPPTSAALGAIEAIGEYGDDVAQRTLRDLLAKMRPRSTEATAAPSSAAVASLE
ncbi:hypothetical protein BC831DRAFT_467414 [Entophlyctis helioformis]|nr:hypothetical protein BC831DRAFT_467414 [Entophlyctis helioformis]